MLCNIMSRKTYLDVPTQTWYSRHNKMAPPRNYESRRTDVKVPPDTSVIDPAWFEKYTCIVSTVPSTNMAGLRTEKTFHACATDRCNFF